MVLRYGVPSHIVGVLTTFESQLVYTPMINAKVGLYRVCCFTSRLISPSPTIRFYADVRLEPGQKGPTRQVLRHDA